MLQFLDSFNQFMWVSLTIEHVNMLILLDNYSLKIHHFFNKCLLFYHCLVKVKIQLWNLILKPLDRLFLLLDFSTQINDPVWITSESVSQISNLWRIFASLKQHFVSKNWSLRVLNQCLKRIHKRLKPLYLPLLSLLEPFLELLISFHHYL